MKINPHIFITYDIHGKYPDDLNEKLLMKLPKFMRIDPLAKKIVVARDARLSSPSLAKVIVEALVETGKEVVDIGISPDPLFYFSIFHFHFDGGIMISGSHNPKEYNGLTIHVRRPGKDISADIIGEDLEKIKQILRKMKNWRKFTIYKEI